MSESGTTRERPELAAPIKIALQLGGGVSGPRDMVVREQKLDLRLPLDIGPNELLGLLADVEGMKRERSPRDFSDGQAIRRALIKHFPDRWGESSPSPHTLKKWRTLANWLGDARNPAKNPAVALWRLAEQYERLPSMIEVFGTKQTPESCRH